MVPLVPKSNKTKSKKEGEQAPPMLRFHDGVHLHQKQQNKKIKKRRAEASLLLILGDGAQLRFEATKKRGAKLC
jgi:hypothetical protein